jgi:hypothetical protein
VKLRTLTLATVLLLTATGLTACSSKVGQAAVVGSARLSISDVGSDVQRGAQPYADQQTGDTVYPGSFAVQAWVQDKLFTLALDKRNHGKVVTAADRRSVDSLLSSAIGSDATTYFRTTYVKLGYTAALAALVQHQQESIILIAHSVEPKVSGHDLLSDLQSSQALNEEIGAVLDAVHVQVSVASRYGSWDSKTISLSTGASAGLPSFVTFGSDTQAKAAAPTTTPTQ